MNKKIELSNGNKVNNQEIKNLCLSIMKAQDSEEVVEILKKKRFMGWSSYLEKLWRC